MRFYRSLLSCSQACAAIMIFTVMAGSPAPAQVAASPLRVAVGVVPPFVMQQGAGPPTGFSIDLWNAVASKLKTGTSYQMFPDVASVVDAIKSKLVDVVAAPVVITAERDEWMDFSLPIVQAGWQVMVRDTGQTAAPNPLADLVDLLFSKTTALWLGIALILVLIPAHLVWLFERRREDGLLGDRRYFPGIFEALYWALSCLTAQAEAMPHQWIARAFSVFWMFAGVVFVAFYTAQLTTTLTVRQIQGAISGPDDLPGKQVATLANSPVADYLRAEKAQVLEFQNLDQMFQALLNKKADAAVFSAPALLYYAAHEGKGLVRTVGPEFNVGPIGFVVQLNSPLRRRINGALLAIREDGTYQQIYNKWFGAQ